MKAIFIAYNQAYYEEIQGLLEKQGVRGFTKWNEITGRGSVTGEAHYGNHTWPTFNDAMLTFVDDDKLSDIMKLLHEHDLKTPELGLRAFAWNVEQTI